MCDQQLGVTTGRRPYRQVIDGVPRSVLITPDILRKRLSFRAGKGDILQCTYPKSGSNWLQYLTQLIITKGKPVKNYGEYALHFRRVEHMECDDWKPEFPVRLLFTHLPLRRDALNREAKYIYMARNPWDVCVSLYRMMSDVSIFRFQDGSFEEFLQPFIEGDLGYGDYFDHVAAGYALRDEPNVFFVTYEEMTEDTRHTVLELAHFLGEDYGRALEEDERVLSNVLEQSKSTIMRNVFVLDFQKNESPHWKELFSRQKVTSKHGNDGDKSKYAMVKEARVGSWNDYFTPEMLVRFEKKIQAEGDKAAFMKLWADIHEEAIAKSNMPNMHFQRS